MIVIFIYFLNIMTLILFYLLEKDKRIKHALAAWYLKKQKLVFNKQNVAIIFIN